MAIYIRQIMEATMTSFDFIKDSMNLTDQQMADYDADLRFIESFVEDHQIRFQDHFKLGFYSHMIGFIDRMKVKEKLAPVDTSIKNDIEDHAFKVTKELIETIAVKYDVVVTECEVILASIHIQTALSMEG